MRRRRWWLAGLLTVAGLNVGTLIGGAVVIEYLYAMPGMGVEIQKAIIGKQYVALQSYVAIIAIGYIAVFGIGSMIGMAALSAMIAVPLVVSARWLNLANSGLQGSVGVITIAIGISTIIARS